MITCCKCAPFSALRHNRVSRVPSRASARDVARPSPEVGPVMAMCLLFMILPSFHGCIYRERKFIAIELLDIRATPYWLICNVAKVGCYTDDGSAITT